jgi:formate hydrogenlyase transcriptional activator
MEYICSTDEDDARRSHTHGSWVEDTEWLRNLLGAPNVGFAICDENLRYTFINQALAKMNGLPVEAHLGKTIEDMLGETAGQIVPWFRRVFSTGQTLEFQLTAELQSRNEVGYWTEHFFPIKDAQGRVKQVGAVVVELPEDVNSRMRRKEYTERLENLVQFSVSLMSTLDAKEVFSAVADFLKRMVAVDLASVALYDPESRTLRIHQLQSTFGAECKQCDSMPVTEAGCGASFLHGEMRIYRRDELRKVEFPCFGHLLSAGIQSVCFLPLITRRGALGSLNLASRDEVAFGDKDLAFLQQLAAQVALALENAESYREIKELTEKLNKEKLYLQDEVRSHRQFEGIIGESVALKRVLGQVRTVAPSNATVLVLGDTGTGKELIARSIHRLSSRNAANFIKLNCAAIPTGLLESELFGHEKGAFTGALTQKIGRLELADKGTLFLDEVGEIPLELQPKLLRVLQDQEFERLGGTRTIKVDIRLVAATNRDLAKSVSRREFRSDLFYRLHVFPIHMPTLRERSRDIPLLVRYFVQKFSKLMNKHIDTVPAEAMQALQAWIWPGNVRELENFIERSVILSQGSTLTVPLAELRSETELWQNDATLEGLEREHILRVLRETGGVIAGLQGAASRLGMKRTTLQSRMQKLGITREEYQN